MGINEILNKFKTEKIKVSKSEDKIPDINTLILKLKNIMTKKVGILRDAISLKEAKEFVNYYKKCDYLYNKKDKNALEFVNMLTVASLIIKAASLREESRGTHQRNDFPQRDDKKWKKHIMLQQDKVYFENT